MSKTVVALTIASLGLAVGCAGGAAEGTTPPAGVGSGATASGPAVGDASFDVPPIDIGGVVFEPDALGRPGMPTADSKQRTTVDKERALAQTSKDPIVRQAHAVVLATMIYRKAKDQKGDEQTASLKDARQVLRDAIASASIKPGDKGDETALRMLGAYEVWIGDDFASAEKTWGDLVAVAPKNKEIQTFRMWWAYSLLKVHKNAEALDAIKDMPIDPKQPEIAYVAAWAKWRLGDNAGAWQAFSAAEKGWDPANKPAIDREQYLFASRTDVALADAEALLVYGPADQQFATLAKLSQALGFAGRWTDAIATVEKAIAVPGAKVPGKDLVGLRLNEMEYMKSLGDPAKATAFAAQALDALPACGADCSNKEKEDVVERVYYTARLFLALYASAHDTRYYDPAKTLYAKVVPLLAMNDSLRKAAQGEQANLEKFFQSLKQGQGKYGDLEIAADLRNHNQEVQACYERVAGANPTLTGSIVLHLDVDQNGKILGAATEPHAGAEGLALAAACIHDHAVAWVLPQLADGFAAKHTTRIKLTYNVAPRK